MKFFWTIGEKLRKAKIEFAAKILRKFQMQIKLRSGILQGMRWNFV